MHIVSLGGEKGKGERTDKERKRKRKRDHAHENEPRLKIYWGKKCSDGN